MKKIIILSLVLLATATQLTAASKKNKKFDKTQIVTEQQTVQLPQEKTITIINPSKQLYGEWTVESVRKKSLTNKERAYIYLDFNNSKFYGNNGCNTVNGKFKQSGSSITFSDVITTVESCPNHNDRGLIKALAEVTRLQVVSQDDVERMHLLNNKGNVLVILKRQNLDILNGPWQVKELVGENVVEKNMRLVIDVNMLTVHANTGCNIINGTVNIDANKDFAIQFEDLRSSNNKCKNIADETNMLLSLEQAEHYKRISDNEIRFVTRTGENVMVITRLNIKR